MKINVFVADSFHIVPFKNRVELYYSLLYHTVFVPYFVFYLCMCVYTYSCISFLFVAARCCLGSWVPVPACNWVPNYFLVFVFVFVFGCVFVLQLYCICCCQVVLVVGQLGSFQRAPGSPI